MKESRYLKAKALTLSDGSFFLCIPLWDEDMERFQRELRFFFDRRGEQVFVSDAGLEVFTKLNGVQLENLSNRIIRKILNERRRRHV